LELLARHKDEVLKDERKCGYSLRLSKNCWKPEDIGSPGRDAGVVHLVLVVLIVARKLELTEQVRRGTLVREIWKDALQKP